MRVGWYVHHHGAGHRTRASLLGGMLSRRGHDVTLLGSGLDPGAQQLALETVALPMDHPLGADGDKDRADVTVNGLLHWAPLRHGGLRRRMALLAAWVDAARPDVFVVDVSSEVAVLVRLLGVPVVVVAQPGDRRDAGHEAALRAATAVLAPWPGWATADLRRVGEPVPGSTGPQAVDAPVVAVGGVARPPAPRTGARAAGTRADGSRRRGLILAGSEGFERADLPALVTRTVTEVDWTVADGRAWLPDVPSLLAGADVVITHAGQNSVAEVAAAKVPAVVLPQRRPFDEQDHMGRSLARAGLAHVVGRAQVRGTDWSAVVSHTVERGGERWSAWECDGAVDRAADLVEAVGRG